MTQTLSVWSEVIGMGADGMTTRLVEYRPTNLWLLDYVAVKPAAVHILTKERFVSADKSYDIECVSSGSKPAAILSWWLGNKQMKRLIKNVSITERNNDFFFIKPSIHAKTLPISITH